MISDPGLRQTAVPVGVAAAMMGVAPGTLRSWGRRYGLVPSGRSAGGHRRFTETDLRRLRYMQHLVSTGSTPAVAAELTRAIPAGELTDEFAGLSTLPAKMRGGPGGRVLAVPGATAEVRGLARAASRLDSDEISGILGDLLAERGVIPTWNDVLRPVLVAAGNRWANTGTGVDIEHVLSEATIDALRAHRACQRKVTHGRPVLLATPAEEQHCLPIYVVAAALAERQVPSLMLGGCAPTPMIASAARRTGAAALFLWRQIAVSNQSDEDILELPATRPAVAIIVGGPGWASGCEPVGALVAPSLEAAVSWLSDAAKS